jgi:YegS/Rv2252/BmrU family lipid kinase
MRRAALIYNPAAGRRRPEVLLPRLVETLAAAGFAAEPRPTAAPGDATNLARKAAEEGFDAVLALGGDGTVREAATGLLGTRVPLGILPGGTVNVLARVLGLPRQPLTAAARLAGFEPRPFDVGLCGATPFLMMVSSGLDAEVLHRLDLRLKARLGQVGIALDGLRRWWSYGYPEIRLEADGEPAAATLAVAANIPLYGGSFRLAPEARWDDRQLDLVLFHGRGRAAALAFAASLVRGTHLGRPDVEVRRVCEVLFHGPAPLQVDGDACREALPATVRLAEEPVWVLAP